MTEDMRERRFVKKPVEVEAMQFMGTLESYLAIVAWMPDGGRSLVTSSTPFDSMYIRTPEGKMKAEKGDWVIRGVKGEFYPCKPDIFAATYEQAALSSAGTSGMPDRADLLGRAMCLLKGMQAAGMRLTIDNREYDLLAPSLRKELEAICADFERGDSLSGKGEATKEVMPSEYSAKEAIPTRSVVEGEHRASIETSASAPDRAEELARELCQICAIGTYDDYTISRVASLLRREMGREPYERMGYCEYSAIHRDTPHWWEPGCVNFKEIE